MIINFCINYFILIKAMYCLRVIIVLGLFGIPW